MKNNKGFVVLAIPLIFGAYVGVMALIGVGKYRVEKRDAQIAHLKVQLGQEPTYDERRATEDFGPLISAK